MIFFIHYRFFLFSCCFLRLLSFADLFLQQVTTISYDFFTQLTIHNLVILAFSVILSRTIRDVFFNRDFSQTSQRYIKQYVSEDSNITVP